MMLGSLTLKQDVLNGTYLSDLVLMAESCFKAIKGGGKIFFCGNGGSAADAQHLAAELIVRLRSQVERPSLPGLSLAMDTSTLTACGNDYGYEHIFARSLSGLGKKGDVLLVISTSGRSPNILRALEMANSMGVLTMGLLGGDGGPALNLCEHKVVIPSQNTARIQEVHITLGHILMELIEDRFVL
tara:strand:- start:60 stop:617 length:558 start_codon:yes stop_codon:yes gene_type:complete